MSDNVAIPGLNSSNAPTNLDFSQMWVCNSCFGIAGPWQYCYEPNSKPLVQHCRCMKANSGEDTWPGFDFNEVVTVCRCCGLELLRSGSRWSVWFCDECKERVRRLHEEFDAYLIPIGRHSIMGGFGLRGKDVQNPAKIEAFVQLTRGLSARMTLLEEWARQVVQRNIEAIGGRDKAERPLTYYLARVNGVERMKQDVFMGLIRFFGIEP